MSSIAKKHKSGAERAAAYRERMRAKGFVPKTIWVPNLKDPEVVEKYRRAAKAIAAGEKGEAELMEWAEAAAADLELGGIPAYRPPNKKT